MLLFQGSILVINFVFECTLEAELSHCSPFCFATCQASVWISDSEHFLKTTQDGAKRCKTEEEVIDLLDMLEGFVKPGLNKQETRLKKLAELSAKLTMDEPRYRAKDLMSKQKEIATKFDLMDNDLFRLAERLRERKQRGLPPKVQLLPVAFLMSFGQVILWSKISAQPSLTHEPCVVKVSLVTPCSYWVSWFV